MSETEPLHERHQPLPIDALAEEGHVKTARGPFLAGEHAQQRVLPFVLHDQASDAGEPEHLRFA